MQLEHVIHSIDPKTAVREVHIALEDKEVVIKETPDGRRETYEIDTKGSEFRSPLQYTIMWFPLDDRQPIRADYTKTVPFDGTVDYFGRGHELPTD